MSPSLLAEPVVLLLLLLGASSLARHSLMGDGDSPVASGGIIMAGGIFVIAALGELGLPGLVGQLVALELLVVWGYVAFSYLRAGLRGDLGDKLRQPANAFAVGTWVAGSAVLGRALVEVLPGWRPLEAVLWVAAVVIWLWYLRLLVPAFRAVRGSPGTYNANGAILLSAVATQSLVVSGSAVLPGGMPQWVSAGLIALGYLFYAAGLVLLVRRYLLRSDWTLADDWDDTNCILHGAMSITGLAIVQSGALPVSWAVATWAWVAIMFVIVEGLEAARLSVRVRAYGLREGVLTYYVSQWSRIFTFGMFYAFTLQLYQSPPDGAWFTGLLGAIAGYGRYVVLAALLAQTSLFLLDRMGPEPKSAAGS